MIFDEFSLEIRKGKHSMSIVYHEKTREFHLYNDKISYIFQIMPGMASWVSSIRERD
ncbi:MAG: hypothetical protein ACLR2E_03865 [Lachnospiraceae bacterium]